MDSEVDKGILLTAGQKSSGSAQLNKRDHHAAQMDQSDYLKRSKRGAECQHQRNAGEISKESELTGRQGH